MKNSIKPSKQYHGLHRFTMVELLVAMSVLVVMMGFLFEFIIGAQKIWNTSAGTSDAFTQAQIVFDTIEQDLTSTRQLFSLPFYLNQKTGTPAGSSGRTLTTQSAICFVGYEPNQETEATNETYFPQLAYHTYFYHRNKDKYTSEANASLQVENRLYRCSLSPTSDDFQYIGQTPDAYEFGKTMFSSTTSQICVVSTSDSDLSENFLKSGETETGKQNLNNKYSLLADHVLDFKFQILERDDEGAFSVPLDASSHYCDWDNDQNRRAVKVTLTLYDENALPKNFDQLSTDKEKEDALFNAARTFSRIIFF